MDIEIFLKSPEYKTMKKEHEKLYFKLFGKYCKKTKNGVEERTATEMNEKFKNKKITIQFVDETITKKGTTVSTSKKISKNFFEIWSNDPVIPEYDNIVFECDESKVSKDDYNLFDGFNHFENVDKKKRDLEPLFEHIKSLVNYDNDDFEYVLNWLSHLVQKPESIPDTALIFISEEGIGKDLFSELIENAIGDKYFGTTEKLEQVCGKFNSILGGKLLMVLNETNPIESAQRIENIKAMITAKKLEIEEKYKSTIKCRNFCRFIFFSNRPFAFPVEDGSRRPKIMMGSTKYLPSYYGEKESADHFSRLSDLFKDKYFQYAFLRYLNRRDISEFNPRKYKKSELHELLVETSRDPLVEFLADYINKKSGILKIRNADLLNEYSFYLKERNYKFDITLKKFTVNLKLKFNVSTIKNSNTHYVIDIDYTKKILVDKYKYKFSTDETEIKTKNSLDTGISEVDDLKNQIKELQQQINELSLENSKLLSKIK